MTTRTLADAEARARIQGDLDSTLVVEAAAGTGKTTALVSRIVSLLKSGRGTLDGIVAVTFTEKAAGELKLRLRAELERARGGATGVESERLIRALAELEMARIGTIHSFCADLLRERPVEARVDPHFQVAAGEEEDFLFDQAFDTWFQDALQNPPEGVRRVLRRKRRGRDAGGPREDLRRAGRDLMWHRDFDAPWRRDPFDRDGTLAAVLDRLAALAPLATRAQRADDFLAQNLAHIARFLQELARREIRGRDPDGLEAELRELARHKSWRWRGGGKWYADGVLRDEVAAQRDEARAELDRVLASTDADLAACLHADLQPLVAAHEGLKARAGRLDFLDLLLRARGLVAGDRVVRGDLQRRFTHILVDEFQDTDPLQAEILLLLAADDPAETDWTRARPVPGKLFVVGDPKQSIYRFRRADVALYEATKLRLLGAGAALIHLTTSFRSSPAIQQAVNAAFAPVMLGQGGTQARYVALDPFRDDAPAQPAVIALPAPRPYTGYGRITKWQIEKSFPDAAGAFIEFLLRQSGWTVTERDRPGLRVPIEPRHICLLFRRFQSWETDVTRPYVEALEARRIPHVLVGGRSFHAREEVLAVRNALTAVEWPDDELSVFATLRGPFFALGDDALLAWRDALGGLHPLRRPEPGALTETTRPVAVALEILAQLHFRRNRRPIADTLQALLRDTRAHAGLAISATGEQALANVLRILDLARRLEAAGATSFRAFVDRLDSDAERGEAGEAPVVEEGTEGVRIMTVHRAKGLEFPVVILADPTAPSAHSKPSRYVDPDRKLWAMPLAGCAPVELLDHQAEVMRRDGEEATRLAYVAATRARDLLVVPVVGEESIEGWLDVLDPAIHPRPDRRLEAEAAPGCPPFGNDTVLDRRGPARDPVVPGLHAPQAGEHRVVWWDPHALALDKEHQGGLRQQRLLEADDGGAADAGVRAQAEWQERRARSLQLGAQPSLRVITATELSASLAGAPGSQVLHESTRVAREGRPHGKRFGTLVHAVLAEVDLAAGEADVAQVAAAQARLVGSPEDEVAAAVRAVRAALAHPLLTKAARSADCRRESALLVRRPDGTILEAVVDLAFREEPGRWVVLDYKTDAQIAGATAQYEAQVRIYAEGIAEATGEPAQGVLLSV